MNLKYKILAESIGYKGSHFKENYFFSNLIKGFKKDYFVFKEDTALIYSKIFGEEYSALFEEVQNNMGILNEEVLQPVLLFEQNSFRNEIYDNLKNNFSLEFISKTPFKNLGAVKIAASINHAALRNAEKQIQEDFSKIPSAVKGTKEASVLQIKEDLADYMNRQAGKVTNTIGKRAKIVGGFFAGLWDKIKEFGKSLIDKFPGVAKFLKNGLNWIIENPFIVAGVAGGAMLLGKLIKVLKEKGDNKRAMKLQAALDQTRQKQEEQK